MKNLQEILEIARPITWSAADILRDYYHGNRRQDLDIQYKDNKIDDPVTAADIAVSNYLIENLQAKLGLEDFGYISEETYQGEQVNKDLVWIIDPLDGTRDFIDKTGEYAIHIGLVQNHRPVLALVAVPETGKIYYATLGNGTFVETRDGNIQRLQVSTQKPIENLTVLVSRSHRSKPLDYILTKLPCQTHKNVGSIGCKIASIVEQQADVYISLSGKSAPKDWDIAAPELILSEAGGKYTQYDTSTLLYNTKDINKWGGMLASNGEYHDLLCQEATKYLAEFENLNK
ncbi:3'(2'),5'-bisphosphate nucleotidase CysQ [Dulcicalothrix desertica PCC 7102]|uniref:inositol-phosphate phosphatase n=1 Tax=Dulcicalothrix desertica PCC 7102 TaxID=232991 RepID=A0A3S1ACD4_9CYAN|nr:inositol monophosphatase family protein [Dulcicalothrix desertica]RUS98048.1 3'(2'),5'-bisphosphate nucleotidase CysQ [Dulcicalothrix desertica PCC 7102]TWH54534.1 3'(2'), 5'-bisphosphate nucleotidase [Dulcicalothrix desertica PCC 7102]